MEPPRSFSDILIGFACPACSGNGGFGMRRADQGASANFIPCGPCEGTGWKTVRAKDLSPEQVRKLASKIPGLTLAEETKAS